MPDSYVLKVSEIPLSNCRAKPSSASLEDIESAMAFASWAKNSAPWWIGDLMKYAEDRYADQAWQAAATYGVSLQRIHQYVAVARKVPPSNRFQSLSWTHHATVANLPHDQQRQLLEHAANEGLGSCEFQKHVREHRSKLLTVFHGAKP